MLRFNSEYYYTLFLRLLTKELFYQADVAFAAGRFSLRIPGSLEIPKQTLARHRRLIAEFYGFRSLSKTDKEQLMDETADLVKQFHRPAEVFRRTVRKLNSRKFVLPGYHFPAKIISREIYKRKLVLSQIIKESLSTQQKQLLDSLLEKEESTSVDATDLDSITDESGFRAKLTLLKNPRNRSNPPPSNPILMIGKFCNPSMKKCPMSSANSI